MLLLSSFVVSNEIVGLIDPVLGVGIQARWIVDLALRQIGVCCHRCCGPSTSFLLLTPL
jgi:hypothetical protein